MEGIIKSQTQIARQKAMKQFLADNPCRNLTDKEQEILTYAILTWYKPDLGELDRPSGQCSIRISQWGNKEFTWANGGSRAVDRICGAAPNQKSALSRAYREAINQQIKDYRLAYPLNPRGICPISGERLGYSAQVDHEVPFSQLTARYEKANGIPLAFRNSEGTWELPSSHRVAWEEFHQEHARLRWLSAISNRYAHQLGCCLV